MENRLLALKLFLDELEVSTSISRVDDRKRVQKAVYLGQLAGVDLGYRFGWYLMGPYSPGLTKDYYALAEAMASDETGEGRKLRPDLVRKLESIRPLLKPKDPELSLENWLELLPSVHYLRFVSDLPDKQAREVFRKEKPHLLPYYNVGLQTVLKSPLKPAV
jgi:uncharacterized protein YwgA